MVDRHGQNCTASDRYGHQKYCELGTLPLKDSRCSFTTWAKNRSLQHPHAHGAINVLQTWVGGQLHRVQHVQMLWAGKAGFGSQSQAARRKTGAQSNRSTHPSPGKRWQVRVKALLSDQGESSEGQPSPSAKHDCSVKGVRCTPAKGGPSVSDMSPMAIADSGASRMILPLTALHDDKSAQASQSASRRWRNNRS